MYLNPKIVSLHLSSCLITPPQPNPYKEGQTAIDSFSFSWESEYNFLPMAERNYMAMTPAINFQAGASPSQSGNA